MVYTPDNKFNGQENDFVTITYPDGNKRKVQSTRSKSSIIKKRRSKILLLFLIRFS